MDLVNLSVDKYNKIRKRHVIKDQLQLIQFTKRKMRERQDETWTFSILTMVEK